MYVSGYDVFSDTNCPYASWGYSICHYRGNEMKSKEDIIMAYGGMGLIIIAGLLLISCYIYSLPLWVGYIVGFLFTTGLLMGIFGVDWCKY